tara:strand:+ start:8142 stop:9740 length:1599 start_codon:yes stop_codon:yes gene_type:complete
MRLVTLFLLLYSGALLAQDTIHYDRLYNKNVGETIEIAYKSRSTGNWEKDYLPNGKWQSLDSNGNVLVETNFRYNRRKKNTKKDGLQVFLDPKTGDTLLMRQFNQGRLVQQLGLQSAILVVDNDVLHIYKDFGSYTIAEYRKNYSGTADFTSIWKSSIEDPSAILRDSNYLRLERQIGDSTLLLPASFSTKSEYNHVSNSEFEKHPNAYFSIMSFENQLTDWSAASISPDFYLSKVGAISGNGYVGIRVFSLRKDVEYVQNRLRKPLKKDSVYCFSAHLKLSPGSRYATNAFGFLLTKEKVFIDTEELLSVKPSKNLNTQILNYKTQWMKVQCTYTAKGGERYLTLGSFQNHKGLKLIEVPGQSPECYYYMEDVSLVPIDKEEDCACNFADAREQTGTSDWVRQIELPERTVFENLHVGDTVILNNIHFDNDASKLLAESFSTLYELLVFLQKNKKVDVKISGHTSSVGGYSHNVVLSERRASAVKRFLTNNGVDTDRIEIEGFGPDYPIASNDTEKGQKENRRVDFSITHR